MLGKRIKSAALKCSAGVAFMPFPATLEKTLLDINRNQEKKRMKQFKKISLISAMTLSALFLAACGQTQPIVPLAPATTSSSSSPETGYFSENVGDRVFFGTDQANLNSAARADLRGQAEWMAQNANVNLLIEGHADERGTRDYNLALGARRANAVRDFLISQGVDSARLQTISYGKERPVSLCSEDSCWSKNRRAVSVVR